MDHLQRAASILDKLLSHDRPQAFSSGWILKRAPGCYHFIRKYIRTEVGPIDWDRVTRALEPRHQRLWTPRLKRNPPPYRNGREVSVIMNKYRNKLYVFIAPASSDDLRIRDLIAIALVRVAQLGNLSAKDELVKLVRYTIDEWLDKYVYMSCWKGREDEIHMQLQGCIRRYRYSGSFLTYVFRTLQYAGRGIRPLSAYSLDDPVGSGAKKCAIDNVIRSPRTNEAICLRGKWAIWRT